MTAADLWCQAEAHARLFDFERALADWTTFAEERPDDPRAVIASRRAVEAAVMLGDHPRFEALAAAHLERHGGQDVEAAGVAARLVDQLLEREAWREAGALAEVWLLRLAPDQRAVRMALEQSQHLPSDHPLRREILDGIRRLGAPLVAPERRPPPQLPAVGRAIARTALIEEPHLPHTPAPPCPTP